MACNFSHLLTARKIFWSFWIDLGKPRIGAMHCRQRRHYGPTGNEEHANQPRMTEGIYHD
jgi:hypothetical protein